MAELERFNFIPYGRQFIDESDKSAVLSVLQSDYLTQGSVVPKFEAKLARYCDAVGGVAVNSATSALHIACLALDVGPGDYVWTSPISFVASSNAALYCGAKVDFVDIDAQSFNMSPGRLRKMLELAKIEKKLPKVVIPVHMCGQSPAMEEIKALGDEFGFRIIEDASHAIGASYKDCKVGCCHYSDITVFSFHPVKIITSGEGGIAVTNEKSLLEKMQLLRSHGITRDANLLHQGDKPTWYYEQQTLGFNYRLTDICAALGVSQLQKVDEFVNKRNAIAKRYDEFFADSNISTPTICEGCFSSYHLYVIRVDNFKTSGLRDRIYSQLRDLDIGTNLHYYPIYKHPFYSTLNTPFSACPNAESYGENALSIPIYPSLSEAEQTYVAKNIRSLLDS